jgi:TIR domain
MPAIDSPGPNSKFDLFISYRREGGDATALFLREKLMQRGLRVFLDVVELHRGYFDEALLTCIANAPNFLVILSPGSLDRCIRPDDWLRQEIAHAIRTKRNIIPVLTRGFAFPAELPEDIRTLPRHQGVEYSHMYHAAMIDSIVQSMESSLVPPVPPVPISPVPVTSPEELSKRSVTPPSETQDRVLDAAMAAQVPVGKPAELTAMIRRSTSAGLKAVLQIEESDARPEDVRSKPFELEFPVDSQGRVQPAQVTLQINAPDFHPPLQRKVLNVPPRADSETYSFLLTPQVEGALRINLELCRGDICLASRLMRSTAVGSDRVATTEKILVSLPIEVKSSGTGAFPASTSEKETVSKAPAPLSPESFPSSERAPRSSAEIPAPAASYRPETGSITRVGAPSAPAPGAGRSSGFSRVSDGSGSLAKLFGVGHGDFQRFTVLAFAIAWLARSFVLRVINYLLHPTGQAASAWVFWLIGMSLEIVIILASLRFLRRALWAGLAAGVGTALIWATVNSVEYSSRSSDSWSLPWLVADTLDIAIFIWILSWVARNTRCRWPALFLGSFAAFFVGSLPFLIVRAIVDDWSWNLLTSLHPHMDIAAAIAFTAVFVFLTTKWNKRS